MYTPIKQFAEALGRWKSTISREIFRNTGKRGYRYQQANRLTMDRHGSKDKDIKLAPELMKQIGAMIHLLYPAWP